MNFRMFARWTCAAALGGTVLAGNVSMPKSLAVCVQHDFQGNVTAL